MTAENMWVYYVIPKTDQAGMELKHSIPLRAKKKNKYADLLVLTH